MDSTSFNFTGVFFLMVALMNPGRTKRDYNLRYITILAKLRKSPFQHKEEEEGVRLFLIMGPNETTTTI